MTIEIQYLIWSVGLFLFQLLLIPPTVLLSGAMVAGAGNREEQLRLPGLAGRIQRAYQNLTENIAPFAALVLIAAFLHKTNAMTALGAAMFFWGRVVYFGVYVAGIPWVRTGVFAVSVTGMLIILLQLI